MKAINGEGEEPMVKEEFKKLSFLYAKQVQSGKGG